MDARHNAARFKITPQSIARSFGHQNREQMPDRRHRRFRSQEANGWMGDTLQIARGRPPTSFRPFFQFRQQGRTQYGGVQFIEPAVETELGMKVMGGLPVVPQAPRR